MSSTVRLRNYLFCIRHNAIQTTSLTPLLLENIHHTAVSITCNNQCS